MRQYAILVALAMALVGCGAADPEDPWLGEPDGFESDDSMATAREQRTNARPVRHTFASNDTDADVDWVRVRVTEPDLTSDPFTEPLYQFASIAIEGTPMFEIWKEHGGESSDPWSGATDLFGIPTPGVYFMKFYEARGKGGEYESFFRLWKQSGGADIAVTRLVVPREMPTGDDTSVDVEISVVNQGSATATGVIVKLYVTTQRYVAGGDFDFESYTIPMDIAPGGAVDYTFTGVDFSGEQKGPVYVIAKADYGDSDQSNDFCVSSTLHDVSTGDGWETLVATDDDTIATLRTPIALGAVEQHTFFPATDVDVVPLVIGSTEEGWYEVSTTNIRGQANTRIEILDDTGVPIASNANASGNGLESGASWVCKGLTEGNYFIWIDEVADLTGAYDLEVRKSDLETGPDLLEPDDDLDTADDVLPWHAIPVPELSMGSTESARSFHRTDDVDWLVYSVPKLNHNATHDIISIGLADGVVPMYELYQADGDQIPVNGVDLFTDTTINRTLGAGLYYIRIVDAASAVGTYKVQATVTP
jgi:hypothetical protein